MVEGFQALHFTALAAAAAEGQTPNGKMIAPTNAEEMWKVNIPNLGIKRIHSIPGFVDKLATVLSRVTDVHAADKGEERAGRSPSQV